MYSVSACGTTPPVSPYRPTMSATWLPTIPPNQRHWSRMCSRSSPTYAGAATQIAIDAGPRPAPPDRARRGVRPRPRGGGPPRGDRPRGDVGVREREDDPVAALARQRERLG